MLKVMIMVNCDSCSQQFLFARTSLCDPNAWRFNTNVLMAMLQDYQWKVEDGGLEHYCLECWGEINAPSEEESISN